MTSNVIYRRQSMAKLYEKLCAQDGEDDMDWLAKFTADFDSDDKPERFVSSVPSPPSAISSGSSSASSSPQNSITSLDLTDHSEGEYDSDSDSDSEIEPIIIDNSNGILFQSYDDIHQSTSDFPAHNLDQDQFLDLPYIPPVQFDAPISLEYNTDSQYTITLENTPSSSFVHQSAPQLSLHALSVTRSTRSFNKRNVSPALHDLDEDVEEGTGTEDTDDEYVPSPSLNPKKRRRSPRDTTTPTPSHQCASPQVKRPRPAPLPRNAQAFPGTIASFASKSNPWACPYCTWVQRNHRTPDLKRHIRTHTRFERPAQWVCCGIPADSATLYNIPHDATPYFRDGKNWIGGCGKEFSRRDALKRHLGNDHISCVGDIDAFANIYDN